MISLQQYLSNPCGMLSIPYWKDKSMTLPNNISIVHDRDFDVNLFIDYKDEQFFRLSHYLQSIKKLSLADYYIVTVTPNDINIVVDIINQCYDDISVSIEQLLSYTKTHVYNNNLWIIVYENCTNSPVACGIADYDSQAKEGVLEWIQVLPQHRGKHIGQLMVNELLHRLKEDCKARFVTVSGKINNISNPQRLYRKCGFEGTDVWHILRRK